MRPLTRTLGPSQNIPKLYATFCICLTTRKVSSPRRLSVLGNKDFNIEVLKMVSGSLLTSIIFDRCTGKDDTGDLNMMSRVRVTVGLVNRFSGAILSS